MAAAVFRERKATRHIGTITKIASAWKKRAKKENIPDKIKYFFRFCRADCFNKIIYHYAGCG